MTNKMSLRAYAKLTIVGRQDALNLSADFHSYAAGQNASYNNNNNNYNCW